MSTERFSNNASTTLGSAISPTAVTIVVAAGTGAQFPALAAGQTFLATLIASGSTTGTPNEIVLVTARSGDTMTVQRAQEGTTAQSWSVGDRFSNFVTAGFMNGLADAGAVQTQSGNFATDSGTANAGVITLTPAPANTATLVGIPIRVLKQGSTNTGAYTLNVNSLGAVVVNIGGATLEGGELVGSDVFEVIYNGTTFDLMSNPGQLHGDRLAGNSVANAALAQMVAATVKGNLSGGTATPYDVPLAALIAAIGVFGYNQTNNNLIASRAFGVRYYNTTSAPIMVTVLAGAPSGVGSASVRCYANDGSGDVPVGGQNSNFSSASTSFMVNPGSSYYVTNTSTYLGVWNEYR